MKLALRRVDWIVVITAIMFAFGCGGGGCGGCLTSLALRTKCAALTFTFPNQIAIGLSRWQKMNDTA